jgi:hypothetical protein
MATVFTICQCQVWEESLNMINRIHKQASGFAVADSPPRQAPPPSAALIDSPDKPGMSLIGRGRDSRILTANFLI